MMIGNVSSIESITASGDFGADYLTEIKTNNVTSTDILAFQKALYESSIQSGIAISSVMKVTNTLEQLMKGQ